MKTPKDISKKFGEFIAKNGLMNKLFYTNFLEMSRKFIVLCVICFILLFNRSKARGSI